MQTPSKGTKFTTNQKSDKHDMMSMVQHEHQQEVEYKKAKHQLRKMVQNPSAGSEDDIEKLRDEIKSRSLLRLVTDERTSNCGKSTSINGNHDDIEVVHILMTPTEEKQIHRDKNDDDVKTPNEEKFGTKFGIKDEYVIHEGEYVMENREDYRTTISCTMKPATKIDVPNLGNIIKENKFFIYVLNPNVINRYEHPGNKGEKKEFSDGIMKIFGKYKWVSAQSEMFNIEENQMVWIDSTIVNLEDLLNKFDSEEMEQNHLI